MIYEYINIKYHVLCHIQTSIFTKASKLPPLVDASSLDVAELPYDSISNAGSDSIILSVSRLTVITF